MATEKAPEKAPETSSTSKSDAEIFQLEALSLNYLRSQNVSAIPDDDYIPKLHPCKLCNKAILSFRFEAFTALTCGHLFHRICLEIHIIRGATKYPACPTCKTDIEIFREETALASGECDVIPRRYDKGKASQQSNVTIDDDMEFMQELGLIAEKGSSSVSVEITKQVNEEGRGTSPIANISVTTQEQATSTITNNSISTQEQATNPITNERGTTNVVQVNSTDQDNTNKTTVLSSKRAIAPEEGTSSKNPPAKKQKSGKKGESSTVKKLIEELTVEITPSINISSPSQATTSDSINFSHLYQEIINAESLNDSASQNMIRSYYNFGKGLVDRLNHYKKSNRERASLILVNDEVREQLPEDITDNTLYKKRERARKIYELFDNIGVSRISCVKSFSAITISKLSWDEIDYIIIACTAPRSRDLTSRSG